MENFICRYYCNHLWCFPIWPHGFIVPMCGVPALKKKVDCKNFLKSLFFQIPSYATYLVHVIISLMEE